MAFRASVGMRAKLCLAVAFALPFIGPASAGDTSPAKTGVARPSVEELATQNEPQKPADNASESTRESICLIIESAARANDLPLEFFARVIWQESRFQSDAVGPLTRGGQCQQSRLRTARGEDSPAVRRQGKPGQLRQPANRCQFHVGDDLIASDAVRIERGG